MALLVDTGVLYALADTSDAWHARCVTYLESNRGTLLAPVTILPEVAYLLRERIGADAERRFVRSIADREIAVESLKFEDLSRALQLLEKYEQIGLVDATVVAIAERLKLSTLATTDRRHFGIVHPSHVKRFTLVP